MSISVLVDWDRNGNFSGTYDDITSRVIGTFSIFNGCSFGNRIGDESVSYLTLNNYDLLYTPDYESGPLYEKLLPGRPFKVVYGSTNLFYGLIEEIAPQPLQFGAPATQATSQITVTSLRSILSNLEAYPDLLTNVRADQVIEYGVLYAGLPPSTLTGWLMGIEGYSEIGVNTYVGGTGDIATLAKGDVTFPYAGDNVQGANNNKRASSSDATPLGDRRTTKSWWDFMALLVQGELGFMYFDRDGLLKFRNRYWALDYVAPTQIFNNTMAGMSFEPAQSLKVNRVEVNFSERSEETNAVLWSLPKPITIPANRKQEYAVEFPDEKAGYDMSTDNVVWEFGGDDATIELNANAQRAIIIIDNDSYYPSRLTSLDLRGVKVSNTNANIVRENQDEIVSIGTRRTHTLNLRMLDDIAEAELAAEMELERLDQSRGAASRLELDGKVNPDEADYIIASEIGDRITITETMTGMSAKRHMIIGKKLTIDCTNDHYTPSFELWPLPVQIYAREHYRGVDTSINNIDISDSQQLTGATFAASSEFNASFSADKAGDSNTSTYWTSANNPADLAANPEWLQQTFSAAWSVRTFTLTATTVTTLWERIPDAFSLQYYDEDGASWETAQTYSGLTWTSGEVKSFSVTNVYTSRYWRILITSVQYATDNYISIAEWQLNTAVHTMATRRAYFGLVAATFEIGFIKLYLASYGLPTGEMTLKLYTVGTTSPSNLVGTSTALRVEDTLDSRQRLIKFEFSSPATADVDGPLWMVLETAGGIDSTNYVEWGAIDKTLVSTLESWWSNDEDGVKDRDDSVLVTGNDLSVTGTPSEAGGVHSNAVSVGASNYLSRATNSSLETGDIDFTFAAWVRFDALPTQNTRLINKWDAGSSDREYMLFYNFGNTRMQFWVSNNGTSTAFVTASNYGGLVADRWYFMVCWHDSASNEIGISIDGLENTAAHSTGVNVGGSDFIFGGSGDGFEIDEVGYWKDKVLTTAERTRLYNGGAGLSFRDLVGDAEADGPFINLNSTFTNAASVWTSAEKSGAYEIYLPKD